MDSLTTFGFEIKPVTKNIDFNQKEYIKPVLSSDQKAQINSLIQYAPSEVVNNAMTNCYILKFKDGLSHELVKLKSGGYMSFYKAANNKTFEGTAALYKLEAQTAMLSTFNVMSAVTGQYFLSQINDELKGIKQSIDKILDFLYENKNAELMSEISFIKYAYNNYSTIILQEPHRIATLTNIQNSKKIAMKNIEFYMNDLESTINQKLELDSIIDSAINIKTRLDLSIQLYSMSSLLEIYYSENKEETFLKYLEKEISIYIKKCDSRINSSFSILDKTIRDFKNTPLKKIDKSLLESKISPIMDFLKSGEESKVLLPVRNALKSIANDKEYYITSDGDLYLKRE